MSIMPNEPLVRVAPASHWNLRNDLSGWRLCSGTKRKILSSPLSEISMCCKKRKKRRRSPVYDYHVRLPTYPSAPIPLFEADRAEMSHGVIVSRSKCMMNYTSFNGCASKTRVLHCHLRYPVCSLRGWTCVDECVCVSTTANAHTWPNYQYHHVIISLMTLFTNLGNTVSPLLP